MGLAVSQGFQNEPLEASSSFRTLLDAMARPATIHSLPVEIESFDSLNKGTMLSILTLTDHESPVWLDEKTNTDGVQNFIRFHCSAPLVQEKSKAMFAVFAEMPNENELADFSIGTSDYPDASVTLIIQVKSLSNEASVTLTGPGIKSKIQLKADGLDGSFWAWVKHNNARFPLGIDVILTTDTTVAALPRSVQVMELV